ncbi:MAG TPA: two-component regulator propeller domain-containing protein [Blastocatellia bacterium]|nr:two-component regulator propeller domain-containing protein [Blastocatellia bacterium]
MLRAIELQKAAIANGIFLLFVVMGLTFAAHAERLPVKIYTSADGLGSSFIDYLMRDSRGFMWFCTRDGLSRFDGSQFITYQIGDETSPPGVETIYEARNGVYWICTTGGLYRFNPNALSTPKVSRNGRPTLNAEFVSSWRGNLLEDSKGNTWFISSNTWLVSNGLYLMEEKEGEISFAKVELNLPLETNKDYGVTSLYEAADGSFWINTTFGLVRRLPDKRVLFYPYQAALIEGVTAMILDKQDRVWLKRGLDLFVFKPEPIESFSHLGRTTEQKLKPTLAVPLQADAEIRMPANPGEALQILGNDYLNQSLLKNMYETSDGHIWITTEKDLFEYDGRVFHHFDSSQGLAIAMGQMAEDTAGNLWFGGQTGLVRLDRKGLISYRESDGLGSPRLNSISEAQDGALYISNGGFFLSKLEGKGFRTIKLNISPSARSIWTSRSAFLDSRGEWWVMTNEGLYRFAAADNFASLNRRPPLAIYTKRDGLKSDGIYQVFEDKRGNIWVSTRGIASESSLSRWSRAENKFYAFTEKENFLSRKAASAFAEDNNGNLWFGFYEGGLARYKDGRFTFFEEEFGLPGGIVTDLLIDRSGRLWASTARGGLYRLDDTTAERPQFVAYTTNDGLSSNNIRTITEDVYGNIFAGTVRGVDRLTPETGRVKYFSVSDGLASDFVVDSYCDKNGMLWFATMNGLSKFASPPNETPPDPQIWLGGLRVSGLAQPVSQLGSANIDPLELTHTQNNFQIDFFGLDFRAGETLRYQYKLEGADEDWSAPSEQRSVTFAHLSPATYRFLVRAINSDGTTSPQTASVTFRILSPIWLRWWFIGLGAMLAATIAFVIIKQRVARRRERQRAQDALRQVNEERLRELEYVRRRIATDLHDDVGSSLTQISLLSEVALKRIDGQAPSVSEPLSMITRTSSELVDSMSDIVWAINPAKDTLSDLSQRMRLFASDVFVARQINFHFTAPDDDQSIKVGANARRELFLIFKEGVNNMVRHSQCAEADIEFRADADSLFLRISDNGKGFDISQESDGHGLVSMAERARSMGGECRITSEAGCGTTLTVTIPLKQSSIVTV